MVFNTNGVGILGLQLTVMNFGNLDFERQQFKALK
jgi:hypothetical protein